VEALFNLPLFFLFGQRTTAILAPPLPFQSDDLGLDKTSFHNLREAPKLGIEAVRELLTSSVSSSNHTSEESKWFSPGPGRASGKSDKERFRVNEYGSTGLPPDNIVELVPSGVVVAVASKSDSSSESGISIAR
jgi:hypothetical protein